MDLPKRMELRSFEDEDKCGKCGTEIVFRPPLPRFFWLHERRKLCNGCGERLETEVLLKPRNEGVSHIKPRSYYD